MLNDSLFQKRWAPAARQKGAERSCSQAWAGTAPAPQDTSLKVGLPLYQNKTRVANRRQETDAILKASLLGKVLGGESLTLSG